MFCRFFTGRRQSPDVLVQAPTLEPPPGQEHAAIKIQKVVRGHIARLDMGRLPRLDLRAARIKSNKIDLFVRPIDYDQAIANLKSKGVHHFTLSKDGQRCRRAVGRILEKVNVTGTGENYNVKTSNDVSKNFTEEEQVFLKAFMFAHRKVQSKLVKNLKNETTPKSKTVPDLTIRGSSPYVSSVHEDKDFWLVGTEPLNTDANTRVLTPDCSSKFEVEEGGYICKLKPGVSAQKIMPERGPDTACFTVFNGQNCSDLNPDLTPTKHFMPVPLDVEETLFTQGVYRSKPHESAHSNEATTAADPRNRSILCVQARPKMDPKVDSIV